MDKAVTICARMMPTVKAVPPAAVTAGAKVLLTLRKLGSAPKALGPSWGHVLRVCLGREYDLIQQASFAPLKRFGVMA